MDKLSNNDRRELEAFRKFLTICAWRKSELRESKLQFAKQAAIAIYGDPFAEGGIEECGSLMEGQS